MPTPADVLATMLRNDASRPRLTFYDDAEGPTRGERIELSAKVLGNWVNKAGNALQEELDAGPGSRIAICLPVHWRAVYWALATWSVGGTVLLASCPGAVPDMAAAADIVITDDPAVAGCATGRAVLVTLTMLARLHPDTPPAAFDEARELASFGDVLEAWEPPSADAIALETSSGDRTAYADVVAVQSDWGVAPRVRLAGDLSQVLAGALSAWALDGSVVIVRDPAGDQAARRAAEGVSLDLS